VIADANAKLARYRAAPEPGNDPALIAAWTGEVTAAKATAQATLRTLGGRARLTDDEITILVLRRAVRRDEADIHRRLGVSSPTSRSRST
jgi:glycosyltransferase A (GT-A) superfamily protein (DUF2064 family)